MLTSEREVREMYPLLSGIVALSVATCAIWGLAIWVSFDEKPDATA